MRVVLALCFLAVVAAVPTGLRTKRVDFSVDAGFDKCEICQEIVTLVDDALVQNKTEIEIKSLLTGMCHALESGPLASLAPFCYEVAQDTTQIVKLIAMEATPDRVCDILFASCANNAPQTFHTTPIDLNADKCDECKTIVGTVEGILAQNSTEQEIEVIMDKLCKLLGNSSFAPICEGIAGNIPAIIQMLENKYTPDEVCAMVGMCNSTSTRVNVAIDKCDVCEEIVGLAEGALAQNKTEEEIETLLNEMCSGALDSHVDWLFVTI
jgi:saposin